MGPLARGTAQSRRVLYLLKIFTETFTISASDRSTVNRRSVLGALCAGSALPVIGYTTNRSGETVSLRYWMTERAAAYDGLEWRLRSLLHRCLGFDHWVLELSGGGIVDVGTENAADAVTDGSWPRALLSGVVRANEIDPAWDVNLLVTDGPLETSPSGYGTAHVAAVPGAGRLAALESVPTPERLEPVTESTFAAQLVLHEVGHALGLDHTDGRRYDRENRSIVTPMLSLYGWHRPELLDAACRPTDAGAVDDGLIRRLDFSYSACARRALRAYDGHHLSI
ncbi:hypothetical protein [Halovivax cerinus]|uniref:Matrixin n=1 Tax=Halovivax cerinus TaxID=1487865 RepID=A0ABD5NMK8_9EURY|nr:hypothetical protein [Halovivax cerinus]